MEKIIKILKDMKPEIAWETETDFIEKGLLVSFDIVRLVVELENEFDVEISPIYILPENFKSVESIFNMVKKIEDED